MGQVLNQIADVIMSCRFSGSIGANPDEVRNSKEYAECQETAAAILEEVFIHTVEWGNDHRSIGDHEFILAGEACPSNDRETWLARSEAESHSIEYWSQVVKRDKYTARGQGVALPTPDYDDLPSSVRRNTNE